MNAICDHDDIKAISFVGSNVVSHLMFFLSQNLLLLRASFSFTLNDV